MWRESDDEKLMLTRLRNWAIHVHLSFLRIYLLYANAKKIQKKTNWWRDNDNLKFVHARDALFEAQTPSALPRARNEWLRSDTQKKKEKMKKIIAEII